MKFILFQESLQKEANFTFAKSGGPGGQNVNKVNTKVFISVNIQNLLGLSLTEKNRITNKLINNLDSEGLLTIYVEDERSQYRNREIALKRIEQIIIQANHQEKKRIPTKPNKTAVLKRLSIKKRKSNIKTYRINPKSEE